MIIEFLGHLHPVFVHLPIGILILAYIIQYFFRTNQDKSKLIDFILIVGLLSSILAAFFGWMLSLSGGYDENMLSLHKWLGIFVCFSSLFLLIIKRIPKNKTTSIIYHASFQVVILALTAAGHFGGELTHGEGYLFSFEEKVSRGSSTNVLNKQKLNDTSSTTVYAGIVQPIFSQKCMQCHNEKKKKGDFQMHNFDALMKGGKTGKALIPGDLEHSELMVRMMLDKNDDKHMPPKGKSQLNKPEQDMLSWWVLHGTSQSVSIKQVSSNDTIKYFLSNVEKIDGVKKEIDSIAPADSVLLSNLKKTKIAVVSIALGSNFLEVNAINTPTFGDNDAAKIGKIAPQIKWLMLSETQITDAALDNMLGCENLEKMNLKNTSITNASITKINKLKKISYLNIVGTKITDAGLLQLIPAQEDMQIYCWNTAITERGIEQFRKKFPKAKVYFGGKY
jgi:uncharacterized membrane protein